MSLSADGNTALVGGAQAGAAWVFVNGPALPLHASFTYAPAEPSLRQAVQFTDTSTGAPTAWSWDFGDGQTSTAENPSHAFTNLGTYTVSLTASTSSGSSTSLQQVTVASGIKYTNTVLVPVATHVSGLNGSQWRTDLALLNTGTATANVQVAFLGTTTVASTTYVPAGAQSVLDDVVAQLGGNGSGAVKVLSDQPIRVRARTYNQVSSTATCYADGTQGQGFAGVAANEGLAAGQIAYLAGLTENAAYRCNIGLVNTGAAPATVRVTLHDGAGNTPALYTVSLAAGQWFRRHSRSGATGRRRRWTAAMLR